MKYQLSILRMIFGSIFTKNPLEVRFRRLTSPYGQEIPLPSVWQHKDLRWMGFEDTWATNDPIAIVWFYSPEFKSDITDSGYAFKVDETDFFRAIKFTNAPTFLIRRNKWYGFKYVIFPFRYNEVINTPLYGTDTVEGIMRLQFEGA